MTIYTIRDIASEFGLSLRTLRFYEQRGLVQPSRLSRVKNASRVYNDDDRARVAEILALTQMGFTLSEIAKGDISTEQYQDQLSICLDRIAELERAIIQIRARLQKIAGAHNS